MRLFKFKSEAAAQKFVEAVGADNVEIVSPTEVRATEFDAKEIEYLWNSMFSLAKNLYESIAEVEKALYDHVNSGHIPPIKGAGRMKEAIRRLGLEDDYEVVKPYIHSSASNIIEVTYKKPEKDES